MKKHPYHKILEKIAKQCAGGKYIFRGESRHFNAKNNNKILIEKPIASGLYRQLLLQKKQDDEFRSFLKKEKEKVDEAKKHIVYATKNIEALVELQHYGGVTSLIDCTNSFNIALFYACTNNVEADGYVYFFEEGQFKPLVDDISYKEKDDILIKPTAKNPRVIFQGSILVHAINGFLERRGNFVMCPKKEKIEILAYLEEKFGINGYTIYNDIYGFIENQKKDFYAEKEFESAKRSYANKNNKNVITYSNRAISVNSQMVEAYYLRGKARIKRGENTKTRYDYNKHAIVDFDQVLTINPRHVGAYYYRGIAKAAKNDFSGAIGDYDIAIKKCPNLKDAYIKRAEAKELNGDKRGAKRDREAARNKTGSVPEDE